MHCWGSGELSFTLLQHPIMKETLLFKLCNVLSLRDTKVVWADIWVMLEQGEKRIHIKGYNSLSVR